MKRDLGRPIELAQFPQGQQHVGSLVRQGLQGVEGGGEIAQGVAPPLFFAKALRSLRKKPIQELYVSSPGQYQVCEKFGFLHQAKVKNILED